MKKVEKNQEALERIAEVYAKALIQFSIAQAAVYAFTIRKFAEEQEALAAPACSPMPEPIEAQHVDPPTEESPYNILDTVVPDLSINVAESELLQREIDRAQMVLLQYLPEGLTPG